MNYSPKGCKELDMTEATELECIYVGNHKFIFKVCESVSAL